MSKYRQELESVRVALQDAGYMAIEQDAVLPGVNHRRADMVAWGTRADGSYGPVVAVEIKQSGSRSAIEDSFDQHIAIAQIGVVAGALGTEINLLVLDDEWFLVDGGMMSATPIAGPPVARNESALLEEQPLIDRFVSSEVFQRAQAIRGVERDPATAGIMSLIDEVSAQTSGNIELPSRRVRIPRASFAAACIQISGRGSRSAPEFATRRDVTDAMLRLAGPLPENSTFFDPFAGRGGLLLTAASQASVSEGAVKCVGFEVNPEVAVLARKTLDLCGWNIDIQERDSLANPLPKVETIVTTPPFGMRMSVPVETAFGLVTDGDVAILARIVDALQPGGRAVVLTTRGWTAKSGSSQLLREWLSQNIRVTALIGVPTLTDGTSVPQLLVVLDRLTPSDTLVADLGADWATELASGASLLGVIPRRGPE